MFAAAPPLPVRGGDIAGRFSAWQPRPAALRGAALALGGRKQRRRGAGQPFGERFFCASLDPKILAPIEKLHPGFDAKEAEASRALDVGAVVLRRAQWVANTVLKPQERLERMEAVAEMLKALELPSPEPDARAYLQSRAERLAARPDECRSRSGYLPFLTEATSVLRAAVAVAGKGMGAKDKAAVDALIGEIEGAAAKAFGTRAGKARQEQAKELAARFAALALAKPLPALRAVCVRRVEELVAEGPAACRKGYATMLSECGNALSWLSESLEAGGGEAFGAPSAAGPAPEEPETDSDVEGPPGGKSKASTIPYDRCSSLLEPPALIGPVQGKEVEADLHPRFEAGRAGRPRPLPAVLADVTAVAGWTGSVLSGRVRRANLACVAAMLRSMTAPAPLPDAGAYVRGRLEALAAAAPEDCRARILSFHPSHFVRASRIYVSGGGGTRRYAAALGECGAALEAALALAGPRLAAANASLLAPASDAAAVGAVVEELRGAGRLAGTNRTARGRRDALRALAARLADAELAAPLPDVREVCVRRLEDLVAEGPAAAKKHYTPALADCAAALTWLNERLVEGGGKAFAVPSVKRSDDAGEEEEEEEDEAGEARAAPRAVADADADAAEQEAAAAAAEQAEEEEEEADEGSLEGVLQRVRRARAELASGSGSDADAPAGVRRVAELLAGVDLPTPAPDMRAYIIARAGQLASGAAAGTDAEACSAFLAEWGASLGAAFRIARAALLSSVANRLARLDPDAPLFDVRAALLLRAESLAGELEVELEGAAASGKLRAYGGFLAECEGALGWLAALAAGETGEGAASAASAESSSLSVDEAEEEEDEEEGEDGEMAARDRPGPAQQAKSSSPASAVPLHPGFDPRRAREGRPLAAVLKDIRDAVSYSWSTSAQAPEARHEGVRCVAEMLAWVDIPGPVPDMRAYLVDGAGRLGAATAGEGRAFLTEWGSVLFLDVAARDRDRGRCCLPSSCCPGLLRRCRRPARPLKTSRLCSLARSSSLAHPRAGVGQDASLRIVGEDLAHEDAAALEELVEEAWEASRPRSALGDTKARAAFFRGFSRRIARLDPDAPLPDVRAALLLRAESLAAAGPAACERAYVPFLEECARALAWLDRTQGGSSAAGPATESPSPKAAVSVERKSTGAGAATAPKKQTPPAPKAPTAVAEAPAPKQKKLGKSGSSGGKQAPRAEAAPVAKLPADGPGELAKNSIVPLPKDEEGAEDGTESSGDEKVEVVRKADPSAKNSIVAPPPKRAEDRGELELEEADEGAEVAAAEAAEAELAPKYASDEAGVEQATGELRDVDLEPEVSGNVAEQGGLAPADPEADAKEEAIDAALEATERPAADELDSAPETRTVAKGEDGGDGNGDGAGLVPEREQVQASRPLERASTPELELLDREASVPAVGADDFAELEERAVRKQADLQPTMIGTLYPGFEAGRAAEARPLAAVLEDVRRGGAWAARVWLPEARHRNVRHVADMLALADLPGPAPDVCTYFVARAERLAVGPASAEECRAFLHECWGILDGAMRVAGPVLRKEDAKALNALIDEVRRAARSPSALQEPGAREAVLLGLAQRLSDLAPNLPLPDVRAALVSRAQKLWAAGPVTCEKAYEPFLAKCTNAMACLLEGSVALPVAAAPPTVEPEPEAPVAAEPSSFLEEEEEEKEEETASNSKEFTLRPLAPADFIPPPRRSPTPDPKPEELLLRLSPPPAGAALRRSPSPLSPPPTPAPEARPLAPEARVSFQSLEELRAATRAVQRAADAEATMIGTLYPGFEAGRAAEARPLAAVLEDVRRGGAWAARVWLPEARHRNVRHVADMLALADLPGPAPDVCTYFVARAERLAAGPASAEECRAFLHECWGILDGAMRVSASALRKEDAEALNALIDEVRAAERAGPLLYDAGARDEFLRGLAWRLEQLGPNLSLPDARAALVSRAQKLWAAGPVTCEKAYEPFLAKCKNAMDWLLDNSDSYNWL
eukprot:tig00020693_g13029.t1